MRTTGDIIPSTAWPPACWGSRAGTIRGHRPEVEYEEVLKGVNGRILTLADAAGVEIGNAAEDRLEPVAAATSTSAWT